MKKETHTGADRRAHTLVLGLGNPVLGDDGVGWHVAQEFQAQHAQQSPPGIEVDCFSLGGLSLMERLAGYDRVILIDAVHTGTRPLGSVTCCELAELGDPGHLHLSSPHDTTLPTALRVGRSLGAHLPEKVIVVGIHVQVADEFSEELTPAVRAAVPGAVRAVESQLAGG